MGDLSAQASIVRVMDHHNTELRAEVLAEVPEPIRALGAQPFLSSEHTRELMRGISLPRGEMLYIRPIAIDDLAARFPCCKVGY